MVINKKTDFMMRRKLLYRIDGCVWSHQLTSRMMTDICDATSHMMMEVGGGTSRTN